VWEWKGPGTYTNADIKSLGHPVVRNTCSQANRKTVHVLSGGAAIVVHVASQTGLMRRVAYEEDALDGAKVRTREFRHGVDRCLRALRVALEDEALVWGCPQGGGDFVDDVSCAG
jgi:hypothetical protein